MNVPLGFSTNDDDHVVLTMTRDDYSSLLFILGFATGSLAKEPPAGGIVEHQRVLALLNRLNIGNPNYTPYKVKKDAQ
jgi:hypothetical protein